MKQLVQRELVYIYVHTGTLTKIFEAKLAECLFIFKMLLP